MSLNRCRNLLYIWSGSFNLKTKSESSPLGREDPIKHSALPVVWTGCQHKHVLDYVEWEAIVRQRAQELSLQESCPFLLQNPLASQVSL